MAFLQGTEPERIRDDILIITDCNERAFTGDRSISGVFDVNNFFEVQVVSSAYIVTEVKAFLA